jgi:predicted peroxiredoxin
VRQRERAREIKREGGREGESTYFTQMAIAVVVSRYEVRFFSSLSSVKLVKKKKIQKNMLYSCLRSNPCYQGGFS